MTAALIITSTCLLVALAALVRITVRAAPGPSLVGKTVVINTHPDDRGYRGVVLAEHADRVVLHQAFTLIHGQEHPMGGLVHLFRKDFASIQQIEG